MFSAQSISRPYIIALISVILFLGIGLFMLRKKEVAIRKDIALNVYADYVLETKKDYIKTAIDRKIDALKQEYEFYKSTTDSSLFSSSKFQILIKKEALQRIKKIQLKKGGYIWVIEVLDYNGGTNYAIQRYNPSRPKRDGEFITTTDHDKRGNYFNAIMLDIIKNDRDPFFKYWYPKLGTDSITQKVSYVKLFKQYNWIIGTGVHLDEIQNFSNKSQFEFDKQFAFYNKTILFYVCLLFLITIFIAFLHKKRIEDLIRFYISKVDKKEQQLILFNNTLETTISNRTKDLININIELEKARDKAEESNKLKTAFLANMSHEVRTPMNSILGFSELLTDQENTPDQINRYVGFIHKSGEQLLNTIDDILDISRLEAQQLKIEQQEVSLNHILQSIYSQTSKLYGITAINFTLVNPNTKDNLSINTDQQRFKQVFFKLISNAYKFTSKGNITIGCSLVEGKRDKKIIFFIKDTGIGIATAKKHLVFKHFSQAGDSEYRQGNGVGLSICKGLIELMGGDIWFSSEKGKGSSFYFTMDLTTTK